MARFLGAFGADDAGRRVALDEEHVVVARPQTGGAERARVAERTVAAANDRGAAGRGVRAELDASAGASRLMATAREAGETVDRLTRAAANRLGVFKVDERAGQSTAALLARQLSRKDGPVRRDHVAL